MLTVIQSIPESKEAGLEHFCEFIEDCEFSELSIKILHLLGDKGPKTQNPAKYIRYIFNRVILETNSVRSAAVRSLVALPVHLADLCRLIQVSSMARIGSTVPALTDHMTVLLKRSLNDNDDEVCEILPARPCQLPCSRVCVPAGPRPCHHVHEPARGQRQQRPARRRLSRRGTG